MKLFFWRRKPQTAPSASPETSLEQAAPSSKVATSLIERSQIPTRPLAMPIELRDALLRFAMDCLVAGGARVRVEADDLISAVLPNGAVVRYTTSLTRARTEDDTELLVQGGSALARLLDECAAHAAVAALRLDAHFDPREIARAQLAVPATGCGACARHGDTELCQRCPVREERIVLAGIPAKAAPRLARQWIGRSIELTYSVVANDRNGRRDEGVRLAFDCGTGRRLPLLASEILADARAQPLPENAAGELDAARARAERALAPQMQATGALLRLLAEREYRARLEDIRTTSRRLLRESPDEVSSIHEALKREQARLSDVFAVDVEARLVSVCFIERPMAALAIPTQSSESIEITADLAAGMLLPPVCAVCDTEVRSASVCAGGHLICSACWREDEAEASACCPVCAGASMSVPQSSRAEDAEALTPTHLDAMSAATWRHFVMWLLEQDGYRIEVGGAAGSLEYWTCQATRSDGALLAGAVRFVDRRRLSRDDVERLVAQRAGHSASSSLLISTAIAGSSAIEAARRLGVRLLDRAALSERLDGLVVRQLHEREAAIRSQEVRAEAAATTRAALLAALQRVEEALASAGNVRRAAGRSSVVAAAAALTDALMSTKRALLAWETLVHDWTAAFEEREARDGSLSIRADTDAFEEMAERARHLGEALTTALKGVTGTPGIGDLGYTVWRRDILEQLSAQCEAYRWRVLSVNPAQWRVFATAHDTLACERADAAATTAAHAAARLSRSYTELARRARIEASTA